MYGLIIGKNFSTAKEMLGNVISYYEEKNIPIVSLTKSGRAVFKNHDYWVVIDQNHPAKMRGYKPKIIYLDHEVNDEEILNNIRVLDIFNIKVYMW